VRSLLYFAAVLTFWSVGPGRVSGDRPIGYASRSDRPRRSVANRSSNGGVAVSAAVNGTIAAPRVTAALSERFWPVAAQRSQDRIARPERCEASRGLASLWCAFEARESRSPLRQRPLSRSSDRDSPTVSTGPQRSAPTWANGDCRGRQRMRPQLRPHGLQASRLRLPTARSRSTP
jgi:hypothetical protein